MDSMTSREPGLTVAVTGPTGTFGFGLIPLLEADDRVARVIGIARRPFDPAEHGWSKMTYRQGDVRDATALQAAFTGADVVIHLAFLIFGAASDSTVRRVNVDGTLAALRAAVAAGARRFVYTSSIAAYGFHRDNPIGMTEDWPVRPARRMRYAQEKAELEHLLREEAGSQPGTDLYVLRPPVVLGPHTVGAKRQLRPLEAVGRRLVARAGRLAIPVPVPALPLQVIHEDDVGQALLLCAMGAGPAGVYNIAADGVLTVADVVREMGLTPVTMPAGPFQAAARLVSGLPTLPLLPSFTQWVEVASHPAIMDTSKAKLALGWVPRYTARHALRSTIARYRGPTARAATDDGSH